MSRNASISFDWAGEERTFRLPIGQLRELQERTGNSGPLTILTRLQSGMWLVDDIRETMRLGLIGGGTDANTALALVRRYVEECPLTESVQYAKFVLGAALFGTEEEPVGKKQPARQNRKATTRTASASPAFTGLAS